MPIPACFKTVWVGDSEFIPDVPFCHGICYVAHEVRNGQTIKLSRNQLGDTPPHSVGMDSLLVAYNAMAELGFYLALGWDLPACVLDLYFEFRLLTSGLPGWPPRRHRKLLDAMAFFGLSGLGAIEKEEMIKLILRGNHSPQEEHDILDYCESDVRAECKLFSAIEPKIDWPRAIYRGRYPAALARTNLVGTPIDEELFGRLQHNWGPIQDRVIGEIDKDYHLYEGRTFKHDQFDRWLFEQNIAWPRTESGQVDLRDETFKEFSYTYPQLKPIRQLRQTLSGMRLHAHAVDKDGRNRPFHNPFGSSTGRNQPRSNEFIFFMPTWYRGLVKPPEGHGLALLDYAGQEFGVCAGHSRDQNMMDAYRSGDPYLWFAKKGGLVPPDATPQTHATERALCKMAVLAIIYEIGAESLALRINQPVLFARQLIQLHHDLFPDYWRWSDRAVNHAMLFGWQSTVFGWIYRLPPEPRPNVLRNFPIQSNGAEMCRLGHCLATENGIQVCCSIHDAYLLEAPVQILPQQIELMQSCMAEASRVVLRGFELFTDVKVIRYPDRYSSSKGEPMWNLVMQLLEEIEAEAVSPAVAELPVLV
jgi:DNA polymerase family A